MAEEYFQAVVLTVLARECWGRRWQYVKDAGVLMAVR